MTIQEKCHSFFNLVILTLIIIFISINCKADEKPQSSPPDSISPLLKSEKNKTHLKNISEIIEYIDTTYSNLYEKLKNNGKIVIFIDPAHGKLPNGKWQGEMTNRLSCTNRPEEYYSNDSRLPQTGHQFL